MECNKIHLNVESCDVNLYKGFEGVHKDSEKHYGANLNLGTIVHVRGRLKGTTTVNKSHVPTLSSAFEARVHPCTLG